MTPANETEALASSLLAELNASEAVASLSSNSALLPPASLHSFLRWVCFGAWTSYLLALRGEARR